jgi:hypothetical protein
MRNTYIDVASNAFGAMTSWRRAFFAVTALCAVLAFALVYQASKVHLVLLPQDTASLTGVKKLDVTALDYATSNPEYLASVAMGDLAILLNWIPESVVLQHQRFLNRLAPALYGEQNVQLLADAEGFRIDAVSQSFFPSETKVAGTNKVRVAGFLVRWVGEKETLRQRVAYVVTYSKFQGFLHVSALNIEK